MNRGQVKFKQTNGKNSINKLKEKEGNKIENMMIFYMKNIRKNALSSQILIKDKEEEGKCLLLHKEMKMKRGK